MIRRATGAEGGTVVWLLLTLHNQPGDALRRLLGRDVGDVEAAIGVELCVGRAERPAARRDLADPAPLPRHDLEYIFQNLQGSPVALGAHRSGVLVLDIGPTFFETPLTKPFFENNAFKEDTLRRIKLGRLGQVEDLMGSVVFLASDAAALITGTSVLVDGGWTAE